ncbi:hypothetical protein [Streptomyces sp. NPDC000983]|uniref:hypothetical protein n=1 Tax=Streptomyces sp. NPDC000983 TaxID=3154373 RepID=UPI003323E5FD
MRARVTLVPAALAATFVAGTGATQAAAHDGPQLNVTNNAPVVSVVSGVDVNDPLEDVLEHTLNFGDGYSWD